MSKRIVILAALGAAFLLLSQQARASDKQYVTIQIIPAGLDVMVRDVHQPHGIWTFKERGETELKNDDIEGKECPDGGVTSIFARGTSGSAVGTEGYFNFYDGENNIGTFKYDSPYLG